MNNPQTNSDKETQQQSSEKIKSSDVNSTQDKTEDDPNRGGSEGQEQTVLHPFNRKDQVKPESAAKQNYKDRRTKKVDGDIAGEPKKYIGMSYDEYDPEYMYPDLDDEDEEFFEGGDVEIYREL